VVAEKRAPPEFESLVVVAVVLPKYLFHDVLSW
jgi:hypothetical protein